VIGKHKYPSDILPRYVFVIVHLFTNYIVELPHVLMYVLSCTFGAFLELHIYVKYVQQFNHVFPKYRM